MIQKLKRWWRRSGTWEKVSEQRVYKVQKENPEGYHLRVEKRMLYKSTYDGETKERAFGLFTRKIFKDSGFEIGDPLKGEYSEDIPHEDNYVHMYIH